MLNSNNISIDLGRWYRYFKPDGSSIELKTLDGKNFIDRGGNMHSFEVLREIAPKAPELLEDDLHWPSGN